MIRRIQEKEEKKAIARSVLESLTDWFEVPEARKKYIRESAEQIMVASFDGERPTGFLCLKPTGRDTAEIAVMGVLKEDHRKGTGTALFRAAKRIAEDEGYAFLQVKTVQEGQYPEYDATNFFYRSLGFREFEVFPELWDKANPCQVYVMALPAALAER